MKIEPPESKPEAQRAQDAFKKLLQRQRPLALAHPGGLGRTPLQAGRTGGDAQRVAANAHAFSARLAAGLGRDVKAQQTLTSARTEAEAASHGRVSARSEGIAAQEHLAKERIAELLARDPDTRREGTPRPLGDAERRREPERLTAPGAQALATTGSAPPSDGPAPVSSVMELVEKVEVFSRSNRPALALTLGGELKGQVEIEKAGPGKVALRLRGVLRSHPEVPERIRRALAERGLTVTRLQIG